MAQQGYVEIDVTTTHEFAHDTTWQLQELKTMEVKLREELDHQVPVRVHACTCVPCACVCVCVCIRR